MNRKKNVLVSSTPHPERTRHIASLFEDVDFSPINELSKSNSKVPNGLLLKTVSSKPSTSVKTGAIRKRRVVSKKETKPESATAGVFKELGVDRKEVGNNALSLSRNLYNMFPEPIILDSDSEENTTLVLKPPKKLKQDSQVTKSSPKKNEEKKTKERAPGSSMITNTRLTRLAVGSKDNKNTKSNSSESVSSVVKELKTSSTKPQTVTKLPGSPSNNRSLIEIDDDDDDEVFPIYKPGASIHQSSKTNKRSENVRLSLELADNFPIQWRGKCKKTTDIDESVLEFVNSDINKNKIEETNKKYNEPSTKPKLGVNEENHLNDLKPSNSEDHKDGCVFKENENIGAKMSNDVQKSCDKIKFRKTSKTDVLQEIEPKGSASIDVKPQSRVRKVSSKEKENSVQISRFVDVVFKVNHANGGIIAKSLKTDKNDVGYLEVVPDIIFQGQNANITFVVIEGKAKVVHLGSHHTLSPGDMIHISSDSGYKFEAAGKGHVRLLYIKAH
ncbi:uncharacterized protein LOC129001612 [Macrosteles quadrilineatus]|uniref:uncharacterized protein LOC129001612 n=1 Tax=Macrosteles quadrilineatus TaxID=74068 RepID=UPI0023E0D6D7|nr:uncharacterized protein LOC129001612 [Macrosteles quadrilineatus]XP_054284949.1 uncharacterized protein LOC129001612 [Macrosteles quadrilineatus]XP_054284950.1 uncharacterized protein LOC129001612 [Macrosteles quadrilineatus]XP_054284951.1 uncharacterized protein LOC129001612 [Macrosteles quadrilineatus]